MKKIMMICVMALLVTSAQAVTVDIYSVFTHVDGGAPYSGLVGSFESPDILFGLAWHPFAQFAFGAEITGCLLVENDDTYSFSLNSDDGSMLYIDGGLVVDNGGPHSPATVVGSTALTEGYHSLRVEFFEDFGGPSGVNLTLPAGVTYSPCTVEVDVDIKGGSCPNPFNPKSKGSVPVAIVGSDDYDVNDIDPDSIMLWLGANFVQAIPDHWILEDSTQPGDYSTDCDDCFDADDPANFNLDLWDTTVTPPVLGTDGTLDTYGGDGNAELVVNFDTQELATLLTGKSKDDCVVLSLTGTTYGGAVEIVGSDSMLIKKNVP